MASSTISPYYNNTSAQAFSLVSSTANGATYKVSTRDLATPFVLEIQRKLTKSAARANDHVVVRIARTERNAETGQLATMQVMTDISIPKDGSILTQSIQLQMLAMMASTINDFAAVASTSVNRQALIDGRDL